MSRDLQLSGDPDFRCSTGLLRSLRFMMPGHDLSKHPGRWRPGSDFVRNERTGEVVYEAPDADLAPRLAGELIDELNAAETSTSAIVRGAMSHLNLVMVHPFEDGNGRMARALLTLVLAREGILEPPFCGIEEYLGRNTEESCAVPAEVGAGGWDPGRDAKPWIRFILKAHYRQARKALVGQGFLDPRGEKRGRRHVASGRLNAATARVRQPRRIEDPFADAA